MTDSTRLDGDVAIVTGAAQGIGQGIAQVLAEAGAKIVLGDVQDAQATVQAIRAQGSDAVSMQMDTSQPQDAQALVPQQEAPARMLPDSRIVGPAMCDGRVHHVHEAGAQVCPAPGKIVDAINSAHESSALIVRNPIFCSRCVLPDRQFDIRAHELLLMRADSPDDPDRACNRVPRCARDYQVRISGPLFDRIDLHVEVPEVSPADLSLPPPAEGSAEVAARVAAARAIQRNRYRDDGLRTNAEADGKLLEDVATPDESGRQLLTQAVELAPHSAAGFHALGLVKQQRGDLQGGSDALRKAMRHEPQPAVLLNFNAMSFHFPSPVRGRRPNHC